MSDDLDYRPWLTCLRCARVTQHRHVTEERVYALKRVSHWIVRHACIRCGLERTYGTIEGPAPIEQGQPSVPRRRHAKPSRPAAIREVAQRVRKHHATLQEELERLALLEKYDLA